MALVPSYRILLLTRFLSVGSFTTYVCSQAYILSLPTPKIPRAYSPNIYFVVAYFSASALLNVAWLRQLVLGRIPLLSLEVEEQFPCLMGTEEKMMPACASGWYQQDLKAVIRHTIATSIHAQCLPYYATGNFLLAAWTTAWLYDYCLLSQLFLTGGLLAQFYPVFMILSSEDETPIMRSNYLTHLVLKVNAGLSMLFLWKDWAMLDKMIHPSPAELVNTGVIFLLMTIASGPDPTLGICLIYDLAALIFGQSNNAEWLRTFRWIMVAVGICLLAELALSKRHNFAWLRLDDKPFVSVEGGEIFNTHDTIVGDLTARKPESTKFILASRI
ncbi:hypothetical protein NLJ89_g3290 [Agrocybe chaxingu]|uniref:Uncharacterized protein n=1 Tax=Agrocybe chaxingu TaxID=84603 RepID=A0A9W8MYE1_9AGAR|nr:hypothetical protein NLJ89_g3290 [Agrocybe chaxingu]